MKVIADTNVWYNLGKDSTLYKSVKDVPISPTYLNLYELAKSTNVTDKEECSRRAVQALFPFQQYQILMPPFTYISRLSDECDFSDKEEGNIKNLVRFITRFASGSSVEDDNARRVGIEAIKRSLEKGAALINNEAAKIRHRIEKNKRRHERGRTDEVIHDFLKSCVTATTNNRCTIDDNFDYGSIELLVKTLGIFFKKLETSPQKFHQMTGLTSLC